MPNYPLLRDDCKNNIEKELNKQGQKVGLLLLRKSPIDQNIEENVGFFKQFGTHIRI